MQNGHDLAHRSIEEDPRDLMLPAVSTQESEFVPNPEGIATLIQENELLKAELEAERARPRPKVRMRDGVFDTCEICFGGIPIWSVDNEAAAIAWAIDNGFEVSI